MRNFNSINTWFREQYGPVNEDALRVSLVYLNEQTKGRGVPRILVPKYMNIMRGSPIEVRKMHPSIETDTTSITESKVLVGQYESFSALRLASKNHSEEERITILPAGIFVGAPLDIKRFFYSCGKKAPHKSKSAVNGFGQKVANISFIDN